MIRRQERPDGCYRRSHDSSSRVSRWAVLLTGSRGMPEAFDTPIRRDEESPRGRRGPARHTPRSTGPFSNPRISRPSSKLRSSPRSPAMCRNGMWTSATM